MQFALFGLLTAIFALKRPYFTLDRWMQRSPHEIGLSPAMWAGDRLNGGRPHIVEFFLQMPHGEPPLPLANNVSPGLSATDVARAEEKSLRFACRERLFHHFHSLPLIELMLLRQLIGQDLDGDRLWRCRLSCGCNVRHGGFLLIRTMPHRGALKKLDAP
jgi:hypothetical protein